MKKLLGVVLAVALTTAGLYPVHACTGIAINATDGTKLLELLNGRVAIWKASSSFCRAVCKTPRLPRPEKTDTPG